MAVGPSILLPAARLAMVRHEGPNNDRELVVVPITERSATAYFGLRAAQIWNKPCPRRLAVSGAHSHDMNVAVGSLLGADCAARHAVVLGMAVQ